MKIGKKSIISPRSRAGFRATEARRGRWIFWAACSQLGKSGLKIARSVSAPEFLRANRLIVASNIVGRGSSTILLIVATRILNFSQLFILYNDYFLIEEKRCHDLSCTSLQIIIIIIKLSYQRGLPQLISSFFLLHSFICFVVELRKDAYSYLYIYLYYKYIMKFVGVTVSNSNIHDRSSRNIFRTPCFHTNIPPFVTTLINVARMFPSRIYTCTFSSLTCIIS